MYTCCTMELHSTLPVRMRPILGVKLRQIRGIVAASTTEKN